MLKKNKKLLNVENLDYYFSNLPNLYLSVEETIVYILYTLYKQDSFGVELIRNLESTKYAISQTILYEALRFLLKENLIEIHSRSKEKHYKGRPPIFYRLTYKSIKNTNDYNELKDITFKLKSHWEKILQKL